MSFDDKQYLLNQQSPPWMSSKKLTSETPEWVDRDEIDNSFTTQPNRSAPREHVIPITFEKSPVKTPNFAGPIPFYGSSQPFHHVISPKTGKLNWLCRQRTNQLFLINSILSQIRMQINSSIKAITTLIFHNNRRNHDLICKKFSSNLNNNKQELELFPFKLKVLNHNKIILSFCKGKTLTLKFEQNSGLRPG